MAKVSSTPPRNAITSQRKHVIITRPEPDGSAFAALIEPLDVNAILSPVMEIRTLDVEPDFQGVTAFAFTSANGVRALVGILGKIEHNALYDLPAYAIGPATAAATRAAGFRNIDIAGGDVKSLSNLIAQRLRDSDKRSALIYHATGSVRQGDLVRMLGEDGIKVHREVIYEAIGVPGLSEAAQAALSDEDCETRVVLFSPRSARLFLKQVEQAGLLGSLSRAHALCLSSAIADILMGTGWHSVKTSAKPEANAIRDLLKPQLC